LNDVQGDTIEELMEQKRIVIGKRLEELYMAARKMIDAIVKSKLEVILKKFSLKES
jgi:hypothetical protein